MNLNSYFIGFSVATLLIVYIFKVPQRITRADTLVKEYYYDNAVQSFFLDLVLIFAYLRVASFGANLLNLNTLVSKTVATIVTTILLSSAFMAFFLTQPAGSSFFATWFRKAGFRAVTYDAVIVSSVFLLSETVNRFICK
tara:strand:- start:1459 stop:1878 length:420 start_codon:yes stop_codon:yes gene_type:complete